MLNIWLKRIIAGFGLLVVVYAMGRGIQLWIDDQFSGERPPYLQMASDTAISLRWQTSTTGSYTIEYGGAPGKLDQRLEVKTGSEEHEVRLVSLRPATRYYYRISRNGQQLYGGEDYWFETAPAPGHSQPVRFVVLGDPGDAGEKQNRVRDAVKMWLQQHPRSQRADMDMILTTGDNAYRSGTNEQFQKAFFLPYAGWLRNYPVWPVYGNHDARRFVFFDIFSFPTQGESGGLASGTEHYFAFDYGDVHFIVLDSEASSMSHDSDMLHWLEKNLAQSRHKWKVVLFHHPPYTRGSHNSDNPGDSGGRMIAARENILPLIEQAGVDLVLNGHSHMYERSYLMKCHYGSSDNLQSPMILDKSADAHYTKINNQGTVYAVVGASGKLDNGPLDHPAMHRSLHEMGALLVDIDTDKLQASYLNQEGKVSDRFTIVKKGSAAMTGTSCQ